MNGIYQKDEWTSFSDVGKTYDDVTFTMEAYLDTEKRYTNLVLSIIEIQGVSSVTLGYLENPRHLSWKHHQKLISTEIEAFMRDSLRETCWGQITANDFIWEAGYDYYIHVGCSLDQATMANMTLSYGLFVEPWEPIESL
ncbi:MAG: hypothetical protein E7645_05710 [Ruminococcaceae bacterium]|nr:hypothetical protein [Oscillospiraceae bacterium]